MKYLMCAALAVAAAVIMAAAPALAADRFSPLSSGVQAHPTQLHQSRHHRDRAREPVQQDASGIRSQAHARLGGPRLDQRPDPNYQNPYRPSYSLDAVNPGEQHPYFQTPKAGFGYPTGNTGVYQGNGIYVIPR